MTKKPTAQPSDDVVATLSDPSTAAESIQPKEEQPTQTPIATADDDLAPLLHHTYIVKECRDLIYYHHTADTYGYNIALANINKKINSISKRLSHPSGILTNPTTRSLYQHAKTILMDVTTDHSLSATHTDRLTHLVSCLHYVHHSDDTTAYTGGFDDVFAAAGVPRGLISQ